MSDFLSCEFIFLFRGKFSFVDRKFLKLSSRIKFTRIITYYDLIKDAFKFKEKQQDAHYADDLTLHAITPAQVESLYLTWNKQQEAVVSMRTQIKQSSCVLNNNEPSLQVTSLEIRKHTSLETLLSDYDYFICTLSDSGFHWYHLSDSCFFIYGLSDTGCSIYPLSDSGFSIYPLSDSGFFIYPLSDSGFFICLLSDSGFFIYPLSDSSFSIFLLSDPFFYIRFVRFCFL